MDDPVIKRDDRNLLIGLAVALLLLLGWFGWQRHKAQQDEYQTSLGLARVLSATFSARDKLEVGRVDGALDVTTVDPGLFRFLRSAQKATLPYSVAYQLDLSQLDTSDYRWDADKRVLRVTIPDVAATAPNIDETRRKTLATDGMFITREAYDNLNRRAALLATRAASAEAQKPEHLNAARANARKAVAGLLQTPLSVAGLGDVRVEVAFPFDAVRSSEHWDVGPSIAEVLAQKQAKQ
ncbi:MAG: DUF4230 domain-containing protein [Sphingomicrobium sp.]